MEEYAHPHKHTNVHTISSLFFSFFVCLPFLLLCLLINLKLNLWHKLSIWWTSHCKRSVAHFLSLLLIFVLIVCLCHYCQHSFIFPIHLSFYRENKTKLYWAFIILSIYKIHLVDSYFYCRTQRHDHYFC